MKSINEKSIRVSLLRSGYQEHDLKALFRILTDVRIIDRVLKNW